MQAWRAADSHRWRVVAAFRDDQLPRMDRACTLDAARWISQHTAAQFVQKVCGSGPRVAVGPADVLRPDAVPGDAEKFSALVAGATFSVEVLLLLVCEIQCQYIRGISFEAPDPFVKSVTSNYK